MVSQVEKALALALDYVKFDGAASVHDENAHPSSKQRPVPWELRRRGERSILCYYRIAGNFSREKTFADRKERCILQRILSRNVETGSIMGVAWPEFCGENFRGWLKNRKIRESFLPRKFPAIR